MNSLWIHGAICLCLALLLNGSVSAGLLYTISSSTDTLQVIDTDTSSLTPTDIGSLGTSFSFGGLAYDTNNDVLYMVDGLGGTNGLYTVDRLTGQATLVGVHGVTRLFGIAYDSQNNVLYGTQFTGTGASLFTLNTSSGAASSVGGLANRIGGLTYDSLNDRLVGIQDGEGNLYEINRGTAAQTLLFNGPANGNSGLAYDPDLNLYWDIDNSGNLYSYDPTNGFAQTLQNSGLGAHDGLAYLSSTIHAVPEPVSLAVFGVGFVCLGLASRYRRQK